MAVLWAVGLFVLFYIAQTIYLAMVLKWEDDHTVGLQYYGRPRSERAAFKRWLRVHALLLSPVLAINSRLTRLDFRRSRITYQGIAAPAGSCSTESFARGAGYTAQGADIFVATQMKCGTTWMQHVVYEVLLRGNGNLVQTGSTLYAVCPWLEGRKSVPLEDAPLVGAQQRRIIKTHFPAGLCPASKDARYIYVARHPVSCFASCIDFVVTNVGRMAPPLAVFEEWYCSADLMWWGTWTDHVQGWWARAQHHDNVLFVYFEDMKRDLAGVVQRVAEFLGEAPLSESELANVVEKCSFDYMQRHQEAFEMQPPHILQTNAALFVSGKADRHRDVPEDTRARLRAWAGQAFPSDHPVLAVYDDLERRGAPLSASGTDLVDQTAANLGR